MDGILNIFQSITQADTKDIIRLSKGIDEHQSFRGKVIIAKHNLIFFLKIIKNNNFFL